MPYTLYSVFFFNDTATTEISTLSLHDALPIWPGAVQHQQVARRAQQQRPHDHGVAAEPVGQEPRHQPADPAEEQQHRSEEHTSELQSRQYLVCRLLLEKKKK